MRHKKNTKWCLNFQWSDNFTYIRKIILPRLIKSTKQIIADIKIITILLIENLLDNILKKTEI